MRISNRLLLTIVLIFFTCSVTAEELRASLAKMPVHALSKSEGIQVDLVNAIAAVSGYDIDIDVYPFARSIDNVISGSADFHIPLIKNEVIPASELPYAYSTETIFQVNFVLYTKKGSEVNKENLANFSIETERAHVDYFPFKLSPSNSIEQSLKRLSLGMIDGYIFADTSTDPLLLKLGYNNISRSLYKVFDVKIVLSKNENGKRIDDILSKSIQTLKANGRLQRIEESVNFPYDNWQPGDL
jgi:polar amino acid transport system substrate-binding protein